MKKICQIGIIVKDLEQKIKHWADILWLGIPEIITVDEHEKSGATYKGKPTLARTRLAIFDLGDLCIELLEPIGSPSTWDDFAKSNEQGIHHIAFATENTDKEVRFYRGKNLDVLQQGDFGTGKYTYLDTFEKLGTVIELLEFYPKAK
jgi:methylmalonyl-CoA/ethylmalonyl-CoA epimerase